MSYTIETYLHIKGKRRSKFKCLHYKKDGTCAYMTKCIGSSQCAFYEEKKEESYEERNTIIMDEEEKTVIPEPFEGVKTVAIEQLHRGRNLRPPKTDRLSEMIKYYEENHCLDKPIYVEIKDGKYYITDKYLRYCAAKKLGLKEVQIRFGGKKQSKYDDCIIKIGARVQHERWGAGTVKKADFKRIVIEFDSGKQISFQTLFCIDERKLIPLKADNKNAMNRELKILSDESEQIKADSETEELIFHIVEDNENSERYYEIKKYCKKSIHRIRFSASGINDLYELLKRNNGLFEKDILQGGEEGENTLETVTGEFKLWSDTEIDFKPTIEKAELSMSTKKQKNNLNEQKLYEIKERIKSKSSFDEYTGISERLMPHQKAACEIAQEYDNFAFFYDTGTGKTVLALEIMACKYNKNHQKFLVICPKPIIKTAWINDQREFYPRMKLLPLSKNINLDDLK